MARGSRDVRPRGVLGSGRQEAAEEPVLADRRVPVAELRDLAREDQGEERRRLEEDQPVGRGSTSIGDLRPSFDAQHGSLYHKGQSWWWRLLLVQSREDRVANDIVSKVSFRVESKAWTDRTSKN